VNESANNERRLQTALKDVPMPMVTWKIMLRRTNQAGYTYVATHQRAQAPSVGEQIQIVANGRTINWTVAEITKDHTTRAGIDCFTVMVEETEIAPKDRE
jgi:hypothetical protein